MDDVQMEQPEYNPLNFPQEEQYDQQDQYYDNQDQAQNYEYQEQPYEQQQMPAYQPDAQSYQQMQFDNNYGQATYDQAQKIDGQQESNDAH